MSTSSQWHARSALGGGHFSDRDTSRTDVPSALSTILVNLCQYDVFALARSDGQSLYETSTGTLTSHLAEFLQGGAIREREHGKMGTVHTKHPLLYPLSDLFYPEFDLIAILA